MFKRNQLYVSLFATSLMVASSAVIAQETVTSTVTVTVQNAFDLTETTPLSFGTIRAIYDTDGGTDIATLVLNPDSTTSITEVGDAEIAVLVAGEPGEFAIANASAFTPMTLSTATSTIALVNANAPGSAAQFDVGSFTFADVNDPSTTGTTVTTDINGAASFLVGASIITDATASLDAYIDGNYSGNFTVQVDY